LVPKVKELFLQLVSTKVLMWESIR